VIDPELLERKRREILSCAESELRVSPALNRLSDEYRWFAEHVSPEWRSLCFDIKVEVEVIDTKQNGMTFVLPGEEGPGRWHWLKRALKRLFGWV
jgi:hypothetical protein